MKHRLDKQRHMNINGTFFEDSKFTTERIIIPKSIPMVKLAMDIPYFAGPKPGEV
jgi:hypothetical protein